MSEGFDWSVFTGTAGDDILQWSPEKVGDKIVGQVSSVEVVATKFGPRPLLVLETDDGPRKVWASAARLRSGLAESNPQVGDKLGILFSDEEDVGKGNPMKIFKVKVEKSTPAEPVDPDTAPF